MKKAITFYVPFTLTLFMLVTMKRNIAVIDGGYSTLWGFPFAYITDAIACSFCYDIFIGPLVLDLLFYFGIVFLLFKMVERMGLKPKIYWLPMVLGLLVSAFWIYAFHLFTLDAVYHFKNTYPVKTQSIQMQLGLFP